eukprot:Blabericola_migrator_1__2948@NODE_184_length_11839_cov_88_277438_g159_i0_p5_GENE_NODE_184_length_11839_cov_88_277438_g159_i0NODE_184_length_11839_cov_88_277438_g159_i0_p5_ORF_typecomplete_len283_score63_13KASH_CCD/PF14662_6/3_3e02KASH_CCD/PF14662_6/4_7e05HOOK/PF05622_12/0_00034DUF3584/PF12128_8/0_0042Cep57_CLD/PF14073_6/1_3e03Cep57_CLD/PF14073_6/0_0056MAD/PF05557_13/0_0079KELK/PF15796_5/2_5e03KELK/PF15796_5/0_054KELK/PF15796_5/33CALCOCO1/PF07888_11/0_07CENPF_leu_zip/PF10473_9/1_1CENPF_leu_zip/PF
MNAENTESNTSAAGPKPLTVDEIRNNLRKKTAKSLAEPEKPLKPASKRTTETGVSSPARPSTTVAETSKKQGKEEEPTAKKTRSNRHHQSPPHPVGSDDLNLIRDKYAELACLSEEILTYCHLLDNSRSHTVNESLNLRETVRELEKLLDSARQREISHLSYVEQHREAISVFEKRYFHLKSRAKTHIKECQDDREKLKTELDSTQTRLKAVESELYAAQSLVHSQMTEVERLKEQQKNMPSEKEITMMSLKLRRLEDENGRLATERAKLMAQLDELGGSKR